LGLEVGNTRLPLVEPEQGELDQLKDVLRQVGLR
jgi:hypothetical protein